MIVELERGRRWLGRGIQQEGLDICRSTASAAAAAKRLAVVPIEALQIHSELALHVLRRCEEHRRLGHVLHTVELGPFRDRMIELVDLLPTRGRHFPFRGPSLFVPRLALSAL